MTNDRFNVLVEDVTKLIKEVLLKKGNEYSNNNDRLINFKVAGRREDVSPERALIGMMAKHEGSVRDLVDYAEFDPNRLSEALIKEKLIDNINYLILLYGLLTERLDETR